MEELTKKSLKGKKRKKFPVRLSRVKFEQKVLQIKRVVKVVKGGKILTFRAVVIIGNTKGKVAVGIGRGQEVARAIEKAILYGKKRLINVPLTISSSIPHVVYSSYGASTIMLRPASEGTGVIAGGAVKTVLELAGIANVLAKQYGSKNLLNNAKATIDALNFLSQKIEVRASQSFQNKEHYEKIMEINVKKKKIRLKNYFKKIRQKVKGRREKIKKKKRTNVKQLT